MTKRKDSCKAMKSCRKAAQVKSKSNFKIATAETLWALATNVVAGLVTAPTHAKRALP